MQVTYQSYTKHCLLLYVYVNECEAIYVNALKLEALCFEVKKEDFSETSFKWNGILHAHKCNFYQLPDSPAAPWRW